MKTEGIPEFEECLEHGLWDYPKKPRVIGCKEIFKKAGDVLY